MKAEDEMDSEFGRKEVEGRKQKRKWLRNSQNEPQVEEPDFSCGPPFNSSPVMPIRI
jgi:hypothetical protein